MGQPAIYGTTHKKAGHSDRYNRLILLPKMARPAGAISNTLFETLEEWNDYLERYAPYFQEDGRGMPDSGSEAQELDQEEPVLPTPFEGPQP